MSERLLGKVCIITGTGGSIGREAALLFAQEGALVVGCDLQVEAAQATVEAVRAAGGTMVSLEPRDLTFFPSAFRPCGSDLKIFHFWCATSYKRSLGV